MDVAGWTEIVLTIALSVALAWPLGLYLARVWQGERTWLDPVLKPVERLVYAACGVRQETQDSCSAALRSRSRGCPEVTALPVGAETLTIGDLEVK